MEDSKLQRLHDTLKKLAPKGNHCKVDCFYSAYSIAAPPEMPLQPGDMKPRAIAAPPLLQGGLGSAGLIKGGFRHKDNGLPKNGLYSYFVKEGHFLKTFNESESEESSVEKDKGATKESKAKRRQAKDAKKSAKKAKKLLAEKQAAEKVRSSSMQPCPEEKARKRKKRTTEALPACGECESTESVKATKKATTKRRRARSTPEGDALDNGTVALSSEEALVKIKKKSKRSTNDATAASSPAPSGKAANGRRKKRKRGDDASFREGEGLPGNAGRSRGEDEGSAETGSSSGTTDVASAEDADAGDGSEDAPSQRKSKQKKKLKRAEAFADPVEALGKATNGPANSNPVEMNKEADTQSKTKKAKRKGKRLSGAAPVCDASLLVPHEDGTASGVHEGEEGEEGLPVAKKKKKKKRKTDEGTRNVAPLIGIIPAVQLGGENSSGGQEKPSSPRRQRKSRKSKREDSRIAEKEQTANELDTAEGEKTRKAKKRAADANGDNPGASARKKGNGSKKAKGI